MQLPSINLTHPNQLGPELSIIHIDTDQSGLTIRTKANIHEPSITPYGETTMLTYTYSNAGVLAINEMFTAEGPESLQAGAFIDLPRDYKLSHVSGNLGRGSLLLDEVAVVKVDVKGHLIMANDATIGEATMHGKKNHTKRNHLSKKGKPESTPAWY